MKVLSLFDGMACGMLAMLGAGVPVDRYVAYKIDKYAVQTSSHNFPNIEHRGDVFKADFTEFHGFDWLVGGSPCTYWSIAQKNNRETEASGLGWELFSQYVRALCEAKPRYFIYENNKSMAPAIRASITETFGFEPICINSALVSAQNRQRLYWVGRRNDDGSYSRVDVEQPADRGILLKDTLETGEDLLSQDKSLCVTARIDGSTPKHTLEKHMGTMVAEPIRVGALPRPNGELSTSQAKRVYSIDGKSVNLTANGGGEGAKTGLYAIPCCSMKVREATKKGYTEIDPMDCVDMTQPNSKTRRGRNMADKANCCMTSCQYYQYCGVLGYATPCEWDDKGNVIKAVSAADGKTYTVYEVKDGQIAIKGKTYPIKMVDGFYIIRKLTVRECMRLQTVPEWYEFPVSKSQAYKMLGNGWTVDVIVHLITSTLMEGETQ